MTNPTFDPNPALFWWEHLTAAQRSFIIARSQDLKINSEIPNLTQYWYSRALSEDLHKLPGWPETRIENMRKM
jgi:hypothetical protein